MCIYLLTLIVASRMNYVQESTAVLFICVTMYVEIGNLSFEMQASEGGYGIN